MRNNTPPPRPPRACCRCATGSVLRDGVVVHTLPQRSGPGPGAYSPRVISNEYVRGRTAKPSSGVVGRQVRTLRGDWRGMGGGDDDADDAADAADDDADDATDDADGNDDDDDVNLNRPYHRYLPLSGQGIRDKNTPYIAKQEKHVYLISVFYYMVGGRFSEFCLINCVVVSYFVTSALIPSLFVF